MAAGFYVAMAEGVRTDDLKARAFLPCLENDIRRETGERDFVAAAPFEAAAVIDRRDIREARLERVKGIEPSS